MKVIELLNKIANGEEVPKKIIGKNSLGKKEKYIYNNFWYIHTFENPDGEEDYYYMNRDIINLNDEVEIIEEPQEHKIPEKIKINDDGTLGFPNGSWSARNMDKAFAIKINEILDYLEEIK